MFYFGWGGLSNQPQGEWLQRLFELHHGIDHGH